jgi:hypothetical protein
MVAGVWPQGRTCSRLGHGCSACGDRPARNSRRHAYGLSNAGYVHGTIREVAAALDESHQHPGIQRSPAHHLIRAAACSQTYGQSPADNA